MKVKYTFGKRTSSPGAILIFLTVGTIITAIGMLLYLDKRYFWCYWGWLEFLLAFAWFEGFVMPADLISNEEKFIGSGYITYSRMVLKTFVISFELLLVCFFLPELQAVKTAAAVAQIVIILIGVLCFRKKFINFLFAALALTPLYFVNWGLVAFCMQLTILLLFFIESRMLIVGQQMQLHGIEEIPPDSVTPAKISSTLMFCSRLEKDSVRALKLKHLAEKVEYSLPAYGKISVVAEYQTLIAKVDELIAKFNSGNISEVESDIQMIDFMIEQLKRACSR